MKDLKSLNQKEIEALINHEKRNLMFYARYYKMLLQKISAEKLEKAIDIHLDRLIELIKRTNE